MDDPHVILGVDAEADHLAEHPIVWQRLGPERIDLEARRLERAAILGVGHLVEEMSRHAKNDDGREEAGPDEQITSLDHLLMNFWRRLPSRFSPV